MRLELPALRSYRKYFKIKTKQNPTKSGTAYSQRVYGTDLVEQIQKHFSEFKVDENDVINTFVYGVNAANAAKARR